MQLSKRTQYGLRAMVCLADAYQRGYLQTKALAAREGLPTKFLESILSALTRGKFLASKIGVTGGYRLARAPRDIFVIDLVTRLEGKRLTAEQPEPATPERPGEIAVRLIQGAAFRGDPQRPRRHEPRPTRRADFATNPRRADVLYLT